MAETRTAAEVKKRPVSRLRTAANTAKTLARKQSEDEKLAKKRVNIGTFFPRWRELRERKGFRSGAELARVLLDRYESTEKRSPPSGARVSDLHDKVKVEEEWDNSNAQEMATQQVGASIEMEWDPNEELEPVSEEDQTETEEDDAESEEDPPMSEEDEAAFEEDEISEEDVNYHDDSNDKDYLPPNRVWTGDGLKRFAHKSRDPSTTDKRRKCQNEHTEERLETTSNRGAEDIDASEQTPTTLYEDDSTASTVEPVDEQNSHEKPPEKPPEKHKQAPHRHKIYDCSTCGRVFSNNTGLRRHLVIHSGKRPYKCFICARGFTQSGNLKTHMKVHRGEVPNWALIQEKKAPKISHVKAHVCGECGMDFPDQQQLQEHRDSHKKPYECSDCGKTFKNEAYFKLHQRMHSGEANFICSNCGKSWPTIESLKKHESTHIKEKNFHCDQCGKAFSKPSALKEHLRTHRGERKYLCTICGKSYSRAHPLKVHLRVHTGEKPYTCDKCGKGFYYSQGFQKHLQIHEKKPKPPTKPLGRPKRLLLEVNS